ncbi:hypothetical protein NE237_018505 [Protea cynaroides]|uniref:Cytochrome b5 heme-binding domain-containing protein n=1 Tax=Protea cynaroides TaxID=273540 RepID=A0A9Q0KA06_9MAGN|nr:hypothetical protein NE237_018505 [Protea cynaroides]
MESPPEPLQLGEIAEEELKAYDGSDPKKPLLMAIKGQVFDVSSSRRFYGPDGPYASLSGKDASRALATMSFKEKDLNGDISGLSPPELDNLHDWENTFKRKYVRVGMVKKIAPSANEMGLSSSGPKSIEGGPIAAEHVEECKPSLASSEPKSIEGGPTAEEHVEECKTSLASSEPKSIEGGPTAEEHVEECKSGLDSSGPTSIEGGPIAAEDVEECKPSLASSGPQSIEGGPIAAEHVEECKPSLAFSGPKSIEGGPVEPEHVDECEPTGRNHWLGCCLMFELLWA